jgi:hypothetical protein
MLRIAIVITGLLACGFGRPPGTTSDRPLVSPLVRIAADSAIFVFPMHASHRWHWASTHDSTIVPIRHHWIAYWDASQRRMEVHRRYMVALDHDGPPSEPPFFGSLSELVARSRPSFGEMFDAGDIPARTAESDSALSASALDAAVVLRIGRSGRLTALRTLRPDSVALEYFRRNAEGVIDSAYRHVVKVEYVP